MKFRLFKNKPWNISSLNPPWNDRKSIYWHLANHIEEDSLGLKNGGEELPDESHIRGDNQITWAAGALDSLLGSSAEGADADRQISTLYEALNDLTEESSDKNLIRFYELASGENVIGSVDRLLEKIVSDPPRHQDNLHTIARWFAMEAADREIVKLAISILGLFRDENDLELLMTLGRHEEFTLFVAVAIQNSEADVDNRLWKLAQHVRGWGRVNIIDRLAATDDSYIKDWLLREGYQNEIMLEYTALICARAGELHRRLVEKDIDDEIVNSARDVLSAILSGSGPAEGYEVYDEGPETYDTYLKLLTERENPIEALVFADQMEIFLSDEKNLAELPTTLKTEWQNRRTAMLSSVAKIKDQSGWQEKVNKQLTAHERLEFWNATEAAKIIGIDAWDNFFERIKKGEDYWWNALQTDDVRRIDTLIQYAEETISLEKIATGPANELGLGFAFEDHQKLDWLLQELRRFPKKGLPLIKTGLRSPVVRNRNMAVRALAEIPVDERSDDLNRALADACSAEPNDDTKEIMRAVMNGQKVAD